MGHEWRGHTVLAVADTVVVISEGRSVATGAPGDVLHREQLRAVWHVGAELEADGSGRTALHVEWLSAAGRPADPAEPAPQPSDASIVARP